MRGSCWYNRLIFYNYIPLVPPWRGIALTIALAVASTMVYYFALSLLLLLPLAFVVVIFVVGTRIVRLLIISLLFSRSRIWLLDFHAISRLLLVDLWI